MYEGGSACSFFNFQNEGVDAFYQRVLMAAGVRFALGAEQLAVQPDPLLWPPPHPSTVLNCCRLLTSCSLGASASLP